MHHEADTGGFLDFLLSKKGREKVTLKNSIRGPIKKAVIRVPIPGIRLQRVPMITQIKSHPIRQKRKGFLLLLEIMMGIAS